MIAIIILIISLVLDGILTNFLPYSVGDLSLFTPFLTLTSLIMVYQFYYHKDKEYMVTAFILGMLYDLFYTNLLFFNGLLFLLISYIVIKWYKVTGFNLISVLIYVPVLIIVYELVYAGIVLAFDLVPMTVERLLYKISHSLILNIIYGELVYLIILLIPNKYKKYMIN